MKNGFTVSTRKTWKEEAYTTCEAKHNSTTVRNEYYRIDSWERLDFPTSWGRSSFGPYKHSNETAHATSDKSSDYPFIRKTLLEAAG
jgi:hypothetical protein